MITDYLIDTHAHLDFSELYDRLEEVLENAKKNNVKRLNGFKKRKAGGIYRLVDTYSSKRSNVYNLSPVCLFLL